jgi:uncharacterized PurR-regulated membrane protein YhhQ (DUF165 family)
MRLPRWAGPVAAVAYVATIIAANWVTAKYPPWFVGGVAITAGTWLIGPAFVLRDVVQLAYNRRTAYLLIVVALAANFAMSRHYADLAWITFASTCAFAISAVVDTEAFTRLRARLPQRVAVSGIGAGLLDSIVFVVVGLSPLTTGIVAWGDVWRVVVAQVIVKSVCVAVCSIPFYRARLAPA